MANAGKVFHTKAHDRRKNEKYYTPAWCVDALLRHFDLSTVPTTWEPAAGAGDLSDAMMKHGHGVVSTDIDPDAGSPLLMRRINFLTQNSHGKDIGAIVTNPPFGTGGRLAFQFCWHALRLMEPVKGKVAMLLRDDFDSAGGRQALFKDHLAWDKKIVLTERVRWVNLPQSTEHGPSGAHAWYIWDWGRRAYGRPATLHYEGRE